MVYLFIDNQILFINIRNFFFFGLSISKFLIIFHSFAYARVIVNYIVIRAVINLVHTLKGFYYHKMPCRIIFLKENPLKINYISVIRLDILLINDTYFTGNIY